MNLTQAYSIFGLDRASSLEDVKKRHRMLVKQWHPDKFSDAGQKSIAHHKTIEINKAYALLKRVKHTRQVVSKETIRATVNYKKPTKKNVNTGQEKPRKKVRYRVVNGPSRFDFLMGTFTSRRHIYVLNRRSVHSKNRARKKAESVDSFFGRRFEEFKKLYRIGFYKSALNRLMDSHKNEPVSSGLGSYSSNAKYEAIVNYEQIKDIIFYAVNKHWNVVFKYIFGIIILGLMIRTILLNYYKGVAVYGIDVFLWQEIVLLLAFLTLFVPDHLFQRLLLARYHRFPASKVKVLFANGKKLPSPWSGYFYSFMIGKFGFLIWLLS